MLYLSRRGAKNSGAIAAAAFILAGCATAYQAPAGDQIARIRLVATQTAINSNTHMRGFDSGSCTNPMDMGMVGGIARMFDEQPLGIPGADSFPKLTFVERKIPAGKPYLFTVRTLSGRGSCVVTASFLPAIGKDYEIATSWEPDTCKVVLYQVSTDAGGNVVRVVDESGKREPDCRAGLN
jgi:hypothetical protein